MSVIRTDPLTGFTTIFAPERSNRPIMITNSGVINDTKEQVEADPFLEGRESETTPELFAIRHPDSKPNEPGWSLRVVANLYPVLIPNVAIPVDQNHYGAHEVIIECPHYESQLTRLELSCYQNMFRAFQQRMIAHRNDPRINSVQIFKNQGVLGGASLGHVHSQLIATQNVPQAIVQEVEAAQKYQLQHGGSLFHALSLEQPAGYLGVVSSTSHFDVICPYASRFAYETWIVPKSLNTHFDHSSDQELDDLAALSRRVLLALEEILGTYDFNFVIQTPPLNTEEQTGYAWSLRIYPRLAHLAGYELSTNMFINPVFPEQAIERLKKQF